MQKLNRDWFVEGLVDFEYKKYLLLSYFQHVKENFNQTKLYPQLSELITHYRDMIRFQESKENLSGNFPQTLTGMDLEKAKLEYESLVEDDALMKEIGLILEFAMPRFRSSMDQGKEIFEFIEEQIEIDPIGIVPLYKDDGYLLVQSGVGTAVKVYEFFISIIQNADEKYRSIRTAYLTSFDWGITNTFEDMKLELIRSRSDRPNPATFSISSGMEFPEEESLLPVAKRKFFRYLAAF